MPQRGETRVRGKNEPARLDYTEVWALREGLAQASGWPSECASGARRECRCGHTCTCICVCAYACIRVFTHTCICIHTYTCICVYVYTRIRVYVYTCTRVRRDSGESSAPLAGVGMPIAAPQPSFAHDRASKNRSPQRKERAVGGAAQKASSWRGGQPKSATPQQRIAEHNPHESTLHAS